MNLGANAKEQAIIFALCFCAGLVGGIISLLFLRKARPVERAFTCFFACVGIACAFVATVEFIMQGKILFYGTIGYAIGVFVPPIVTIKIKKRLQTMAKKKK